MQVSDIIAKKPYLIWYTKDYSKLSDRVVLEAVLNYGDWEDVQSFIKIKGIEATSQLFFDLKKLKRSNFLPNIEAYFTRYFDKYSR